MPTRPLLLVSALAGGDYLLWNWSTDGHSATLALISGLALAPLIIALLWLLAVSVARTVIARPPRMPRLRPARGRGAQARRAGSRGVGEFWDRDETPEETAGPSSQRGSEKIAA